MNTPSNYRMVLLTALALYATPAAAENIKVYTGVGLGNFGVDYGHDATGAAIKGNSAFGGYLSVAADLNPYLSLEFRYGRGGSSTLKRNGANWAGHSVSIDGLSSMLIRPQFPVEHHGHLYAMFGISSGKLRYVNGGVAKTTSKSGLSYGAGFKVHIQDTFSVGFEYTRYTSRRNFSKNHGQISGYALQLHYLLD